MGPATLTRPFLMYAATVNGEPTNYANTDLDLTSAARPTVLVAALESGGLCRLNDLERCDGVWRATLERSVATEPDPATTIAGLLDAIESLNEEAGAAWDDCLERVFDVGIQAGIRPHSTRYDIPPELLWRMAAAGVELRFTVYAPETARR